MLPEFLNTQVLISLGGNMGDVAQTFDQVVERLNHVEEIDVVTRSSNYTTQPVGVDAGELFVNAAMILETTLSPELLFDQLQKIENELGRVRSLRWGPRGIDLDLVLYGEQIIETERLTVPHPACFYRRFVLDPAVEIAPHWVHPLFQLPLVTLRERLLPRPLRVSILEDVQLLEKLKTTSNAQIEFSVEPHASAAITFDATGQTVIPQTESPQMIDLTGIDDRFTFVEQVLLAATDEPQRIAKG